MSPSLEGKVAVVTGASRGLGRDVAAGTVRVLRGNGGKARTVALDALARSAVEAWLRYARR